MADNNTLHYQAVDNEAARTAVRLAAITKERGYYPTGSETELRLAQLETDLTARDANGTALLAHYDTVETN